MKYIDLTEDGVHKPREQRRAQTQRLDILRRGEAEAKFNAAFDQRRILVTARPQPGGMNGRCFGEDENIAERVGRC